MAIFFITFVILLLVGVPISISIGASAVLGCLVLDYPMMVIGQKMVTGIDSYLLIAIPLFILAGNLMNAGKITDKIFSFAKELVGWIPGGLGHANVVASIIFAGMSGSAAADAGGLGTIEMEAMTKNGYDEDFSGAVTAASSVIGPIFPPSIPLIIYGATASVSVAKLFMGGVLPGLLMGVALMVLVFLFAIKYKFERHPFRLAALARQFFGSILSLITPLIILAGFTTGWFTPTEASSIAVAYSLIIALIVYRTMDWKTFTDCLLESAITSANTLFIIGTSTLFTYVLVKEGASAEIASFILGISQNPAVILFIINVVLLILGMFMEPGAILTLMLPVLLPIVKDLNIDLVHFGVVMVLNLMIGQVTPPFGVCLFIISDVAKIKLDRLYKSILPFLIPLVVVLFMCTYIPGIVTWLPNMLVK
ncbi:MULTISPECIES: TRAP transporter large permease [Enterocloster]|uniref:TRAP transporter, DctM subunit n=1 Tax=Enterocloster lavalensis TaxID=460384 RepID=A0A1I0JTL9_9FIRM|nr:MULTISPECIES: TRAP transporter large permease [Enterocloster]MDR3755234.1 TRAP transporter large permease [Enterocloster sp.]PST31586.1 TRAP transporter large permease [Enterocloster lavalensis]SEU14154.1 TRAP transporter, DctM subunit [Enterocloster lavalensis]